MIADGPPRPASASAESRTESWPERLTRTGLDIRDATPASMLATGESPEPRDGLTLFSRGGLPQPRRIGGTCPAADRGAQAPLDRRQARPAGRRAGLTAV